MKYENEQAIEEYAERCKQYRRAHSTMRKIGELILDVVGASALAAMWFILWFI